MKMFNGPELCFGFMVKGILLTFPYAILDVPRQGCHRYLTLFMLNAPVNKYIDLIGSTCISQTIFAQET